MAASKALKDITDDFEEQLTCSLCLDVFNEPKTLPCLHSFCAKCIAQWFKTGGNPFNNEMECPMCKTTVVVPDGDSSKFPPSFYFDSLLQLLHAMKSKAANQPEFPHCVKCEKTHILVAFCAQCNGMICEACFNAHKLFKELQDEHQPLMLDQLKQENVISFIKTQNLCKFHDKKKLEYICKTCAVCICQKCATLDHPNHQMQSLEDAAQDSRELIIEAMNRVEKRKDTFRQELERSKENIERIQREVDLAEEDVDNAVEMIFDLAKEHGRAKKDELRQTLRELKTANDDEQVTIKDRLKESDEFIQHCQALLKRGFHYEEIEGRQMVEERAKMLLQSGSVLCGQSVKRDVTILYSLKEQVMPSLLDIGRIVKNATDPSQSIFKLVESPNGFINEGKIITRNTEGKLCPTRIESIDVRIKDKEGKEMEKKVTEEKPGKYGVRFKTQNNGPYKIQVKIGGEAIKNSFQNVEILDVKELFIPLKTFGESGSGRSQLRNPQSIALSDNEEIAVADWKNHRIQIFSLDGKYKSHFGRQGTGKGQLSNPHGVIFNKDSIIVSDGIDGKGRVQEFDLKGTYVRSIYRAEQWLAPFGMCVNDERNIAVCCCGNKHLDIKPSIKVFSKQGVFIHEFNMPDNYEDPLNITYGNGKYFVSYLDNNCVRVFDMNGIFLYKFGETGEQDGQFNDVAGLAVYGPDLLLVCDSSNHRVQLFTQEGQFLGSFGSRGPGAGQIDLPSDVVATADGRVFVTEYMGNRVSVLS